MRSVAAILFFLGPLGSAIDVTTTVRITNYRDLEECTAANACAKIINKKGTLRNLWECWIDAPQKCWYQARLSIDGTVPQAALCKTASSEFGVDISGLRPSFVLPGPTSGSIYFGLPEEFTGKCEWWVTEASYAGGSGAGEETCELSDPVIGSITPLFTTAANEARRMELNDGLADFSMSTHNLLVVKGLDDDECAHEVSSVEFGNLLQEVMFFGARGPEEVYSTRAPVTTTRAPTTTTAAPTGPLTPIEFCQQTVGSKNQLPTSFCRTYCTTYWDETRWCPKGHDDETGETLLHCVVAMNPSACVDPRIITNAPEEAEATTSTTSTVKPVARAALARLQTWSWAQWNARVAINWEPTTCPEEFS